MATNRFKRAKKEDEIKAIFSSTTKEEPKVEPTPQKDVVEVESIKSTPKDEPKTQNTVSHETVTLNTHLETTDDIEKFSDKIAPPSLVKMDKLGVSIKTNSKKRLDKLSAKLRRKPNNVVTLLLDNLYDEDSKTFKVDIPKKDTAKITSYHMKKDHINAINKLSKKTGHNKSEIFNMLLELALSVEED